MPEIKIYFAQDGAAHIRFDIADGIPDRETLERVAEIIREHKKSPAQSGNSEQGSTTETAEANKHLDNTTSAVLRQEAMQILSQLPADDVEEITQRARDMIKGRA